MINIPIHCLLSALIILLVLFLLANTHVQVWYSHPILKKVDEYDYKLSMSTIIIIIIVGFIPIINVLSFIFFLLYYGVHNLWEPMCNKGTTHVFSLNSRNLICRILKKIKNMYLKH